MLTDVVEYRERFLERISHYEKRMYKYIGDDCGIVLRPDLADGENR